MSSTAAWGRSQLCGPHNSWLSHSAAWRRWQHAGSYVGDRDGVSCALQVLLNWVYCQCYRVPKHKSWTLPQMRLFPRIYGGVFITKLFKFLHILHGAWPMQLCRTPWSGSVPIFLAFFYSMNPTHAPGSLVKRLKWFCWKIQFCGDISEISDSALTNTVRSRTPRRLPLSGVIKLNLKKLKIDYHCGESDSALTNTVRNRTPRRLTLRGVKQILFAFKYLHLQGIQGSYVDFSNYFRKSKIN